MGSKIERAVYTLWLDDRKKENNGFSSSEELACCLALSLEYSKKQFKAVELYTNTAGKELIQDKFQLPFDKVHVTHNSLEDFLHQDLWAYAKILTYSLQDSPFIHIDNDVILFDKVPVEKLEADLLFQNKEFLSEHGGYNALVEKLRGVPKVNEEILKLSKNLKFAYNCGVVGANNLDFIREWYLHAHNYLFSPSNKGFWDSLLDKHSQNHLFEQLFCSILVKHNDLEGGTKLLLDGENILEVYSQAKSESGFRMTHLWGKEKRDSSTMSRLKARLFKEFPEYMGKIYGEVNHKQVFSDIYRNNFWGNGSGPGSTPQITFEYRSYLEEKIYNIRPKNIVDLGCGDFQFMSLVRLPREVQYFGVDCVPEVVEKVKVIYETDNLSFISGDIRDLDSIKGLVSPEKPIDLVLVKDVLIHWPNNEVKKFLDRLLKLCRFAIITNQVDGNENKDIVAGDYRPLNIEVDPFNVKVEEEFVWSSDRKITYLVRGVEQ